jgi:uncharacterized protein
MSEVFADTYYFIAVFGPDAPDRRKAVTLGASLAESMVTTEWVLTEVANFMHRAHERQAFSDLVATLDASGDVVLVKSSHELWRRGLELYGSRLDKEWSLTDCISFVVMADRHMRDALTADHHFEQAGFNALLK